MLRAEPQALSRTARVIVERDGTVLRVRASSMLCLFDIWPARGVAVEPTTRGPSVRVGVLHRRRTTDLHPMSSARHGLGPLRTSIAKHGLARRRLGGIRLDNFLAASLPSRRTLRPQSQQNIFAKPFGFRAQHVPRRSRYGEDANEQRFVRQSRLQHLIANVRGPANTRAAPTPRGTPGCVSPSSASS